MKKNKKNHGFTLIELIISAVLAGIILAMAGSIFLFFDKWYINNEKKTRIEKEPEYLSSYIFQEISKYDSSSYKLTFTIDDTSFKIEILDSESQAVNQIEFQKYEEEPNMLVIQNLKSESKYTYSFPDITEVVCNVSNTSSIVSLSVSYTYKDTTKTKTYSKYFKALAIQS